MSCYPVVHSYLPTIDLNSQMICAHPYPKRDCSNLFFRHSTEKIRPLNNRVLSTPIIVKSVANVASPLRGTHHDTDLKSKIDFESISYVFANISSSKLKKFAQAIPSHIACGAVVMKEVIDLIEKEAVDGNLSVEDAWVIEASIGHLFKTKYTIQNGSSIEYINSFLIHALAKTDRYFEARFLGNFNEAKNKHLNVDYSEPGFMGLVDFIKTGKINNFLENYFEDDDALQELLELSDYCDISSIEHKLRIPLLRKKIEEAVECIQHQEYEELVKLLFSELPDCTVSTTPDYNIQICFSDVKSKIDEEMLDQVCHMLKHIQNNLYFARNEEELEVELYIGFIPANIQITDAQFDQSLESLNLFTRKIFPFVTILDLTNLSPDGLVDDYPSFLQACSIIAKNKPHLRN